MIELRSPRDQARLRRLALASQGLLQARPFGRGLTGARRAIGHLGYVQIDSISVVERAHHHVLHSRVPGFEPAMIDTMLLAGEIFEYWTHAAALLPIDDFRFSLPYKHAIKSGTARWYKNPDRKLMGELLARIRSDGPLRSRDLETVRTNTGGWWDWKPTKRALEQLYMQGDLMVRSREGFEKTYDLTERVLPPSVNSKMPGPQEHAAHLLRQQLRSHGAVSLKGLTYQRRDPQLRNAVKALVRERLARGALVPVQATGGEVYLVEPGALEHGVSRRNNRMSILSPFDNSVIQRDRLRALFQYEYQLECYVPEAKRQFGYFCLLLLYRDEFIGQMDCRAHRNESRLEVKSFHLRRHDFDEDSVVTAFLDAVGRFADFQKCDRVSLTQASPKRLTRPLRSALRARE